MTAETAETADGRARRFGPWRRELRAFLELFALSGIAVVQPVLDLLSKNATLFVTLRSTKAQTIALALLVVLVPPVALWAIEVVVGLAVPALRRWAHAVLATLVIAVFAVETLKEQTELAARTLIVIAVAFAIIAGVAVFRFEIVRLWLRFLAIAPVVFVVMFLFFSPVTTAVFDGGPAAADTTVANPSRVVMIVLDELPIRSLLDDQGEIDAALFPNFATLAGDSTWYRNQTTVSPNTDTAVPAILTGDYPEDSDSLPVAQDHPHSLFTLLGETYDMNVHETVTQLCPRSMCGSTTAGTQRHGLGPLLRDTADLWREFAVPDDEPPPPDFDGIVVSSATTPVGSEFVQSLEPAEGPRLDFLHILMPHQPWHLRDGFRDDENRGRPQGQFASNWASEAAAQAGRQRHLLQLRATDELLGQVMDKLKRISAYDESLIVLTADHGVAFTTLNPERGVSNDNWPEIMWTPLFVKTPSQPAGQVDDRPVQSIDVLPTIADLLDTKLPWKVDGASILGEPRPDGPRRILEWEHNRVEPPPGRSFLTFDGPTGFAQVLRSGSPPVGGDPKLALYRLGAYGGLVGRPAAPLVDRTATGPVGIIFHREVFEDVERRAKLIPWAYIQGSLRFPERDRTLAITVNGTIAGLASTVSRAFEQRTVFWANVAPQFFVDGKNDIGVYLVSGDPAAPVLVPVKLREPARG